MMYAVLALVGLVAGGVAGVMIAVPLWLIISDIPATM